MVFEAAVKLASTGAFGVCVFAILWVGWVLKDTPEDAKNKLAALRRFMVLCGFIALIAGIAGIMSSRHNADQVTEVQEQMTSKEQEHAAAIKSLTQEKEQLSLQSD
jgi:hypothetical protein